MRLGHVFVFEAEGVKLGYQAALRSDWAALPRKLIIVFRPKPRKQARTRCSQPDDTLAATAPLVLLLSMGSARPWLI